MTALWIALLSFGLSWLATHGVLRRAGQLNLVQAPNHRSSHVQPTPTGGGLGMALAATVVGGWLAVTQGLPLYPLLLGVPLMLLGFWDDRGHLPARLRLAVQLVVVAALLTLLGDLPVVSLPELVAVPAGFTLAVLLVTGVWWINLFNFMDGIDGIAAVQGGTMLVVATGLIAWQSPAAFGDVMWLSILCLAAAVLGFLVLNWSPARIFMGDAGSTWLSFMIFAVALLTIQRGWLNYGCWLVLAAVFVIDATVTLLTRLLRGERWYEAHRSHAYQRLARRWGADRVAGHRAVALLVLTLNLLWLTPLAAAMLIWPAYSVGWLTAAWLPLVIAAVLLRAGRAEGS